MSEFHGLQGTGVYCNSVEFFSNAANNTCVSLQERNFFIYLSFQERKIWVILSLWERKD